MLLSVDEGAFHFVRYQHAQKEKVFSDLANFLTLLSMDGLQLFALTNWEFALSS